jgi:hypothetical protein
MTHRRHPANGYSIISSVRAISIGGTWSPKRLRGFEIDDQLRPIGHQAAAGDDGALDLAGVAHVDRAHLHPKRRRRGLDSAPLADPGGNSGIPNDWPPASRSARSA